MDIKQTLVDIDGLTEADAAKLVMDRGFTFLVTRRDQKGYKHNAAEHIQTRIKVEIEEDCIVRAKIG